jgi:hypothetical protein
MGLYELIVMGAPSNGQVEELGGYIARLIEPFGLELGKEVKWSVLPGAFEPDQMTPVAVAFFGGAGVSDVGLSSLLLAGVPILPIASRDDQIAVEIPPQLRALNCVTVAGHGPERIATALLECVALLPRQRRVFVSYRRDEARQAALQLFNSFSGRLFDVFLDTHGIAPAEHFQAVLWHRLCDSDVLVMLDTPGYFNSRWTNAEYGRALAKGISVLRIGWPGVNPSPRAATASRIDLIAGDIDVASGQLTDAVIERICTQLEFVRAQSHAVRGLNLFSNLKLAIERIGGGVAGVGVHNAIYLKLPNGKAIVAYPAVGVPTSVTLNEAVDRAFAAVVYDHVGLDERWIKHLAWLGDNIHAARWVKASEAAWTFAGWEVQ